MAKINIGEGTWADIRAKINTMLTELYNGSGSGSPTYTIGEGNWSTIRTNINSMYQELMAATAPTTVAPTTTSAPTTTATPTTTAGPNTLLTGLISYYEFEEVSGTAVLDSHASNNGTTTALVNQTGFFGKAHDYSGHKEADMGDTVALKPSGAFSITAWYTTFHTEGGIMGCWAAGNGYKFYQVYGSGVMELVISNNWASALITGGTALNDSTWHHVAATFDGTTLNLYVDGVTDANPVVAGLTQAYEVGRHVFIGSMGGATYAEDLIDDVGIWNRVLSAVEVSALYNNGSGLAYTGFAAPTTTAGPTTTAAPSFYTDNFQSYSAGTLPGQGNWILGINDIYVFASGSDRGVAGNLVNNLNCAIYNASFSNDQYAQITIISTPSYASNGVGVRLTGSGNTLCGYMWVKSGGNGAFYRITNGVGAGGYYGSSTVIHNGDVLRLEAVGNVLSCFINGVLDTGMNSTGHITDSTYASGKAGICSDSGEFGIIADNWQGGNL